MARTGHTTSPSEALEEAVWCEQWCRTGQPDELPYHHPKCPVAEKLRDCWTTPEWLTVALPKVTLDPCSNPRSTVKATRHVMLEPTIEVPLSSGPDGDIAHGDGLAVSWKNRSVFINGPFSNLLPWARKTEEARAFIFLANDAHTTKWYRELVNNGGLYRFDFDKRIRFNPPPRIKPSTNNRDQVLICNREGYDMIGSALDQYGRWWFERNGYLKTQRI